MALVQYLDWEVRTTGHDLNCSGFNPDRDTVNGVDYTQQDAAEITSLNWTVDGTNNTWIRSTELTNWVNSGKTLASLKGNHIHIAGKAIGGNTLFQWVASTAVPGAYYLQALGGGNPNWPTKPTRFWMNKVFVLENTSLPSGSNSWTYGDKDSLGYSTIYVRFGAESDADPNIKAQDDIIADGQTWTRGAYEIVNVGTDGNGPYLVLDRSPGAAGITAGYGRIGGAMYSPGGAVSIGAVPVIWIKFGTYYYNSKDGVPGGFCSNGYANTVAIGYDSARRFRPTSFPIVDLSGVPSGWGSVPMSLLWLRIQNSPFEYRSCTIVDCELVNMRFNSCGLYKCKVTDGLGGQNAFVYCYVVNYSDNPGYRSSEYSFSIIVGGTNKVGINYGRARCFNNVVYAKNGNGLYTSDINDGYENQWRGLQYYDSNVVVNCSGYAIRATNTSRCSINQRLFYYQCTLGPYPSGSLVDPNHVIQLPGNPFRDPANGDFRLADNEAGRMLKQAGFQIPGPQGAPPMKFDAGAVQNSFYDIASGSGAFVLPPRTIGA